MAYVKKIIGNNERIIGITRLHWIYLAKGLFGFLVCLIMGLAIDAMLFKTLSSISEIAPNTGGKMLAVASYWVTPLFIIFGGFYFLLHLLKVLYTEIALTEKRIIHKSGFIFVKIHEIDIEEISGENMDMGYFGSALGYGYIMLDCRFIGDTRLPAIAQANVFIKALHAARTKVTPVYPDAQTIAQAIVNKIPETSSADQKPAHEMLKAQAPKPNEPQRDENGDIVTKAEAASPEITAETTSGTTAEHEKEILQLQIAKLELEVKLEEVKTSNSAEEAQADDIKKPMDSATPPAPSHPPTISAPTVAALEIAQMPQVTDKIAEKLIASGLIPHPDDIKPEKEFVEEPLRPKAPTDAERLEPTNADALITSFGSAAFVFKSMEDGKLRPEPAI